MRLGDFGMLRAQLSELLRFRLVALLCPPYDQPGRPACRQQRVMWLGHHWEGRRRRPMSRYLALRLAQALRVAGDGRIASRIATLLERAIEAQGITAARVPPFQDIGFIRIEDTAASIAPARALGQGCRPQIAKHRTLANAQMGGNAIARPPLLPQRPHLLMACDPVGPTLGRLLLSSRRWRGDGGGDGAVSKGHPLPTQGVIDGLERLTVRVEDLLKGFHQILEHMKPIGDLGRLWCPLTRTVGIGFGPIARDDLHSRVCP